jgi:hypothetical protein
MWMMFLCLPTSVAGANDLDASWAQAYGYILKNNFQAGQDYIFTYGPLGYFTRTATFYDTELFWYKYAWELAVNFVFVLIILKFANGFRTWLGKLLFCIFVVPLFLWTELTVTVIFLLGVITLREDKTSWTWLAAVAVVLAVLGLVKFNFFVLSLAVLACMSLNLLANHRLGAGLGLPALFVTVFGALWLALGQSLDNLPRYLIGFLQISSGYSEAMMTDENPILLYVGLLIIISLAVALLPFAAPKLPDAWRGLGSLRQLSRLGLVGAALFMNWKHAFVRHGGIEFFPFTLLLSLLLPSLLPIYDWKAVLRVRLTTACLVLSFIGFVIGSAGQENLLEWTWKLPAIVKDRAKDNGYWVLHPTLLQSNGENLKPPQEEYCSLPLIKARVGDAPIDMLSCDQATLLWNYLNWKPRPVFQSYSTYTPWLLEANAQFFRSAQAPPYVLFKLDPIDDKMATLEDGLALRVLLQRYRPVLAEKGFLLLERLAKTAHRDVPAGRVVLDQAIKFGEWISLSSLPGNYHTLAVRLRPSWWGSLRTFLYKSPELSIKVCTAADPKGQTYRLVPGMAETGFILNPLLSNAEDVLELYRENAGGGNRVTAFTITCRDPACYADEIAVTIASVPRLVGRPIDQNVLNQVRYPMMRTPFSRVHAQQRVSTEIVDDKDVLVVHAPSKVEFDVPARSERHRIVGHFGILPSAYEDAHAHTDGVHFAVEYLAPGQKPQVLFLQELDPFPRPADRGMQSFRAWLPPGGAGTVVLRAYNGPDKSDYLDLSYWTEVEIEGVKPLSPAGDRDEDPDRKYQRLVGQLRQLVAQKVPAGARVLVISGGDDALLRLPARTGWHFPRTRDGSWGANPGTSEEAIAHLEALRVQGGQYLLIPEPYAWWLEHYRDFKKHLDSRYQRIVNAPPGTLYRLTEPKKDSNRNSK